MRCRELALAAAGAAAASLRAVGTAGWAAPHSLYAPAVALLAPHALPLAVATVSTPLSPHAARAASSSSFACAGSAAARSFSSTAPHSPARSGSGAPSPAPAPSREEVLRAIRSRGRRYRGLRRGWQVAAAAWVKKAHVDRGDRKVGLHDASGRFHIIEDLRPRYVVPPGLATTPLRPYVAHYKQRGSGEAALAAGGDAGEENP